MDMIWWRSCINMNGYGSVTKNLFKEQTLCIFQEKLFGNSTVNFWLPGFQPTISIAAFKTLQSILSSKTVTICLDFFSGLGSMLRFKSLLNSHRITMLWVVMLFFSVHITSSNGIEGSWYDIHENKILMSGWSRRYRQVYGVKDPFSGCERYCNQVSMWGGGRVLFGPSLLYLVSDLHIQISWLWWVASKNEVTLWSSIYHFSHYNRHQKKVTEV